MLTTGDSVGRSNGAEEGGKLVRIKIGCWVAWIVLMHCANLQAQTIEDEGWWGAVFSQGDLGGQNATPSRWRWWFDGHARFQDDADGFNVSIVRPGIGYKLTDTATFWAGYGWIRNSPTSGADDFDENRIWQQITWSRSLHPTKLGFRSRLEQRFLETGDDTGWRFRQLLAARTPLAGSNGQLTFVVWDEVFVHLNDTDFGAETGFNQNRLFVGFGINANPATKSRVEIGYLNQFIDSSSGDDRMNHLLSVNLFLQ